MIAREVDERDGRWEDESLGYRVVFLRESGVHWRTFDLESETLTSVEEWAIEHADGSTFSIAVRVGAEGGVGLIWLTPPPEASLDADRT